MEYTIVDINVTITIKEAGHGKKVGANILVESVDAESSSGELAVTEKDQLTETDPVKPHEGVPRQDEPENKKERSNGKKVKAKFLVESVGRTLLLGSLKSLKQTN